MIVDTSAIVALILDEPEALAVRDALRSVGRASMSAATYVELGAVLVRRAGDASTRRIDALLRELGVELVPLTVEHAALARAGYAEYGRGSGHPAGLDLGDCFGYALAAATGEPLLFVGDDLSHTDVVPAI